jgi:hypothetical protein
MTIQSASKLALGFALLAFGSLATVQPAFSEHDADRTLLNIREEKSDNEYQLLDVENKGTEKGAMVSRKKQKKAKAEERENESSYFLIEEETEDVAKK